MEYANQIQEFTERSVSGCASGYTQCLHSADKEYFSFNDTVDTNIILSFLAFNGVTKIE